MNHQLQLAHKLLESAEDLTVLANDSGQPTRVTRLLAVRNDIKVVAACLLRDVADQLTSDPDGGPD